MSKINQSKKSVGRGHKANQQNIKIKSSKAKTEKQSITATDENIKKNESVKKVPSKVSNQSFFLV